MPASEKAETNDTLKQLIAKSSPKTICDALRSHLGNNEEDFKYFSARLEQAVAAKGKTLKLAASTNISLLLKQRPKNIAGRATEENSAMKKAASRANLGTNGAKMEKWVLVVVILLLL